MESFSGFYYKLQWWSLWRRLFLTPWCGSLFLANLQVFIINSSNGACDRICFYLHAVRESVFSNASGLYYNSLLWLIGLTHIQSVAVNLKKIMWSSWNFHAQNVTMIYLGRSKAVKFKTWKINTINSSVCYL